MRRSEIVEDCGMLRRAADIAPFLLRLRNEHPRRYAEIVDAVRLATPFFDDFLLDVALTFGEKRKVKLSWRQGFRTTCSRTISPTARSASSA